MQPQDTYHFCPRCGTPGTPSRVFVCTTCSLTLHHGPTVATAVFLRRSDKKWLFIRRAKEPALGKLAPPGGFLDTGEAAEIGAVRELKEEVGLLPENLSYIGTFPNLYLYKGVSYPVLDIFFHGKAPEMEATQCPDEVAEILWLDTAEVFADDLAFPSMRKAWVRLMETLAAHES